MKSLMPILILEDNPRDAELIIEALRKAGFEFDAKHATTKEEFLAALRNHAPELILADYALCDFNGFSALAAAQEQCPEVPFIFVSGLLGDERVLSALHHGATDCVSKDRLDLLGPIAHHALREKEEVRKRKQAEHARQETSELYRTLAEQSADAIVILDPATTRPVEFNTAAHRQLGYSREEFAQLRLADIDAIKTPEEIQAIIAGMLHDGRRKFETQHRTRDGQIRDVEVTTQVAELSGRCVHHCLWRDITERKRVEERLHLLSQAMEASANATLVTDLDGVITWANTAFAGLTGYPLAEALGQKISFLKSGVQDQAFYQRLWETILAGRVCFSEIVNKRKDGSLYNEENTITPVRAESGEITHFIAVKRDITERKRAELRIAAFASLGQRLNSAKTAREASEIIVQVADGLLGWDACLFDLYSAAENRVSHLLKMDLIDGRRTEYIPRPDRLDRPPSELSRRVIEQGGQLISRDCLQTMRPGSVPFGDTSRLSASIMFVPIRHGTEVVGVLSIQSYTNAAYDASSLETLQALADHAGGALERLRAQEVSQTVQRRLGRLLSQSPTMIYSLNTDGKTTELGWVSENVERLLGYTLAECLGPQGLLDQIHPHDRTEVANSLVQLITTREIAREYRVRHKSGNYHWVHDEQRLICDAQGAPFEIVGSWVDITNRKTIEGQLRQAQKMEAVGQLAGGVAHDFNNLLAVIRGNADLALMDAEHCSVEVREGLKHVVAASERAAGLTRQLLAFSRKQVMQSQPLVLNDLIVNLTKMLRRIITENIDMQCHCTVPLPYIQADPGMMEQVLLNLVVNARDAMPGGGQLRIATEITRLDEAQARLNPEARAGEFVCLLVSDSGIGIDPEILPHIFEPFFTTKETGKGTGLGLATLYSIVKQHHGWVDVASQIGKGTTLKVFLPSIPTPARPETRAEVITPVPGGNETILLVEDDPEVRLLTQRLLTCKGYRIWEAKSAQEALDLWQRNAKEIALVLTDMLMPGSLTGCDLAERLQQENPDLKVIFLTGYSAEASGAQVGILEQSGRRFLQKPCPWRTLLETIRQCLDDHGMPKVG